LISYDKRLREAQYKLPSKETENSLAFQNESASAASIEINA
jgi:hypothetical protein